MKKEIDALELAAGIMFNSGVCDKDEIQKEMISQVNSRNEDRDAITAEYGQTWDTDELTRDFEVIGFCAPYCTVRRKTDGKKGSIMFRHSPRIYFDFVPEN